MYTSDVSRFKYRVNQPRMYRTNRHINTYRVYGSIISTNIHKPGRCTFFGYNNILFLASILALSDACHLWSIYTTTIAECTFSPIGIFVGLAQQSKWNVSESYQLIQTCAQIKLQTKKQKTIITWSLKQMVWLITWTNNTKVIQRWKEHFTYDLPSGNLISFFPSGP